MDAQRAKVTLKLCPLSNFEGQEDYDDHTLPWPHTSQSLNDIGQTVLRDLELDLETYKVHFHAPGDCKARFLLRVLTNKYDYDYYDESGAFDVRVHVVPKLAPPVLPPHQIPDPVPDSPAASGAEAAKVPGSTPNRRSARLSKIKEIDDGDTIVVKHTHRPKRKASIPSTRDGSVILTTAASERPKREASTASTSGGSAASITAASEENNEEPDAAPVYIRIGRGEKSKTQGKNVVEHDAIVVAAVMREKVQYLSVYGWQFNACQIGRCELGIVVCGNTILDAAFARYVTVFELKSDLIKRAKEILDGTEPSPKKARLGETRSIATISLPQTPSHSTVDFEPAAIIPENKATIPAVANFVDKTTASNLELDGNVQFDLKWNETGSAFTTSLLPRLTSSYVENKLNETLGYSEWELEVWVLPQVKYSVTMYSWTKQSDLRACDWMSAGMSTVHGRKLYLEIVVVDKKAGV